MSRLASILFAAILIASSAEHVQSAELDPFGAESVASPSVAGVPQSVPKKSEQSDTAKRATGRASGQPQHTPAQRVESISAEPPAAAAARARIESVLSATTQFEYLDEPLKDVVDDIHVRHEIQIVFDRRALEDVGTDLSTPVTISVAGTTLRSALRLLLRNLDLTYVIHDEVLMITTSDAAKSQLSTRFYPVPETIPCREDLESINTLLTDSVAPESWDSVGGTAHAAYVPGLKAWAVTQTDDNFPEVDGFFSAILRLSEQAHRRL